MNKQMTAEKMRTYYADTPEREKQMIILVSMYLRSFALEIVYWARNEEKIGSSLFDYCETHEEAERILEALRTFKFLPKINEETK